MECILYENPICRGFERDTGSCSRGNAKDRDRSIYESISRTKRAISDYALCNDWEYFITFTLSPKILDRYDYDKITTKMSNWFDLARKRKAPNLKYLIVPEQHKDNAWHFHALLSNIGNITLIDSDKKDSKGNTLYNIKDYRLGYSTASKVEDNHKVSSYVLKYITKSLVEETFNKKRYWTSKNLKKPLVIKENLEQSEFKNKLANNYIDSNSYFTKEIIDNDIIIQKLYTTTHNNLSLLPKQLREAIEMFGVDKVRLKQKYET